MVADNCVQGHTAYIYDRGGMQMLGQLRDMAQVRWTRDRDGTSVADVLITGRACISNRSLTARAITKRHELVIFRGDDRVWEGPIFRLGDEGDRITVHAKDISAYLYGTALSKDWDNRFRADYDTNGNPTTIYTQPTTVPLRLKQIIEYELNTNRTGRTVGGGTATIPAWEKLTPPANVLPHLTVHTYSDDAKTSAFTFAKEMTVGEHMEGMARTAGVDWTVVGRALHIWDVDRYLGRTRTMTEADFFGRVIVTEYGADHTQIAYTAVGEGQIGEAVNPANMSLYGPWTTIYTPYSENPENVPTQEEMDSQATRNTSGRSPVPVEVRIPDNSSVRLGSGLGIQHLVPGVQIPLLATMNDRSWSQMQKIDHLTVTESGAGESVQLTLTPATKSDEELAEQMGNI